MKNIILSKLFLKESDSICDYDCQMVEVDEEECDCGGCSEDFMVSTSNFTQDFLWHPKKKF